MRGGGWGGKKRITNVEATIIEQVKPIKIPGAWYKAPYAAKQA